MTTPAKALTHLLDIPISDRAGRGVRGQDLEVEFMRELGEGDLEMIANPPKSGVKWGRPVLRLRHSHHLVARLIAEGRRPEEVSAISGYTTQRVWLLKRDPAFVELVEYYRQQTEAIYLDVHQRLAALGIDTVEELHERLLTEPEKFKNRELIEMMEAVLDRSVAPAKGGPKATGGGVQVNINFTKATSKVLDDIIDLEVDDAQGDEGT